MFHSSSAILNLPIIQKYLHLFLTECEDIQEKKVNRYKTYKVNKCDYITSRETLIRRIYNPRNIPFFMHGEHASLALQKFRKFAISYVF